MNAPHANQPDSDAPASPGIQSEEPTQPVPDDDDPRLPGTTDEDDIPVDNPSG